jgi:hypothetical protein
MEGKSVGAVGVRLENDVVTEWSGSRATTKRRRLVTVYSTNLTSIKYVWVRVCWKTERVFFFFFFSGFGW